MGWWIKLPLLEGNKNLSYESYEWKKSIIPLISLQSEMQVK